VSLNLRLLPVVIACEMLKTLVGLVASPSVPGSSQETHASSTYDQVIPTRFPYNDDPCEQSSSNSEHSKDSADRHRRYDRRFGGMS
jgi:hypothetical protein